MLDNHLFKNDLKRWEVSEASLRERLTFKLLHEKY